MRYAFIDTNSNLVVNVVEIIDGDTSTEPHGFLNVRSDTANIGDGWNGTAIVPKPVPPTLPRA